MNYIKNDHVIYVGRGFSLFAFIFASGGLLSKGLWGYGIMFMLIQIPIYFYAIAGNSFLTTLTEKKEVNLTQAYLLITNAILQGMHFLIGFKGNQWKKTSLICKGYKLLE